MTKNLLIKEDLLKPPRVGEIVEGKVIAKDKGKLFLDLGPIGTGIIYGKEFSDAKEEIRYLKIGDSLFAKIVDLDNEDGYIELSISQAGKQLAIEKLKQKKDNEEKIIVKIRGANKGGLVTEVMGIPAFLPVSQLSSEHYPRVENGEAIEILRKLQKFVGKEFEVKILDFSQNGKQIILSEKIKELEKIKEALKNYKPGDIVEGEITGITDFGAFMRFPLPKANQDEAKEENYLLEGLIHISELDWKIIENPAEVVKVGERVKAKIIDISGEKVFLSLKALKKDPWQEIEKKYKKEDIISGKVTKFNPFGAFVQVKPDIQGLCHISQFTNREEMENKLKIGKTYNFQILEIKPQEHHLSLKLVK